MTKIGDCSIIEIPKIDDPSGSVGVVEKEVIPFDIKRVFYLFDVPNDRSRGKHAHKKLCQFLIALNGSFEVVLRDGISKKKVTLNKPTMGLLIKPGIWSELNNFSKESVCLVLASDVYEEEDYIRDFNEYMLIKNGSSDIYTF